MNSFDIFDTLITRNTATPAGIFSVMQKRLQGEKRYAEINSYVKNNFVILRQNAEHLAREDKSLKGIEDITIEQIYEALRLTGQINLEQSQLIMELEIQTESDNIVGIEENINKVKQCVEAKNNVVLISDMYLSENIIRKLLVSIDSIFAKIPIYISAEWGKSKAKGGLYEIVKQHEGIENNSEWLHVGDNWHSDVVVPREKGIIAEQYKFRMLMPWEKKVLQESESNREKQITIGLARKCRMKQYLSIQEMIGTSFGGAVLYPYVLWILKECERRNIRRLYFIARDGYILKQMADILIKEFDLRIQSAYIYGSRAAWRVASFTNDTLDLYKLFQWSYYKRIVEIEDVCSVLQISYDEIEAYLPLGCRDRNHRLTDSSLYYLVKKLNESQGFRKFYLERLGEKHNLVIGYLCQNIDYQDQKFAFVELGGGGYTQGCFANLMKEITEYPIRTFYYKLDRMNVVNNCENYVFLPSYMDHNLILEMICRAPHGQTEGYRRENDRYVPILREDESKYLIDYGYVDYIRGIIDFTKEYCKMQGGIEQDISIDLLMEYMLYATKNPDRILLNFFANMPNSLSGREKKIIPFAPQLSKREMWDYFFMQKIECGKLKYSGSDIDYSILRCTKKDKKRINRYKKMANSKMATLIIKGKQKKNRKKMLTDLVEYPIDMLGENIVLYGAGKYGCLIFETIKQKRSGRVVLWVDQRYREMKGYPMPISPPSAILSNSYDEVLITVADSSLAKEIKRDLLELGVLESKIQWFAFRKISIEV